MFPGALRQFALRFQFGELRFVIGVGDRAGPQAVADGKADVVGGHDLADLVPMRVEKTFLMMRQAPFGHDRAAAGDDAGGALRRQRDETQQNAGMDGEVVHALLGLFDQACREKFPRSVLRLCRRLFPAPDKSARCRSGTGELRIIHSRVA